MSERIEFSEVVYSNPEVHAACAGEIIGKLQSGICAFDEPLHWGSSDGMSIYFAEPLEFRKGSEDPVPYGRLRDMTLMGLAQTMQVWRMRRLTFRPDEAAVMQENFIIHPGRAVVTTALGSMAVLEEGVHGDFARNSLNDDLRDIQRNTRPASVRDYANLDNALADLAPLIDQKWKEHSEYLRNMTPEDMRNHRAMKRDLIIAPEEDKTATPKFWGITVGSTVWLVKATSAEKAVLDLEDHFKLGLEPLFLFFADPYNDEIQTMLSKKYADGGIRRLIPWSIVEWPDNPDTMTDEQIAAFDKFK